MKPLLKKIFPLVFASTVLSACASSLLHSERSFQVDGNEFQLRSFRPSVDGSYYFGLEDWSTVWSLPSVSHLLTLSTLGEIKFQRSFSNEYRPMGAVFFRPFVDSSLVYFLAYDGSNGMPGMINFLDAKYRDAFIRKVPDDSVGVDLHDLAVGKNGNIFYLFTRIDSRNLQVNSEIQEWDPKGNIVFAWNAREHLRVDKAEFRSNSSPLEINSMDVDSDSNLLISFRDTNEIVKVSYPSGQILWRLSKKNWSFPSDPLNGFEQQHCVRAIGRDHILLFDNGDFSPSRFPRAVEYSIDPISHRATLVWEYRLNSAQNYPTYGGTVQRLSNGNTLIGWGTPKRNDRDLKRAMPLFTEVNAAGEKVRELISNRPFASYRIFFQEEAKK